MVYCVYLSRKGSHQTVIIRENVPGRSSHVHTNLPLPYCIWQCQHKQPISLSTSGSHQGSQVTDWSCTKFPQLWYGVRMVATCSRLATGISSHEYGSQLYLKWTKCRIHEIIHCYITLIYLGDSWGVHASEVFDELGRLNWHKPEKNGLFPMIEENSLLHW